MAYSDVSRTVTTLYRSFDFLILPFIMLWQPDVQNFSDLSRVTVIWGQAREGQGFSEPSTGVIFLPEIGILYEAL